MDGGGMDMLDSTTSSPSKPIRKPTCRRRGIPCLFSKLVCKPFRVAKANTVGILIRIEDHCHGSHVARYRASPEPRVGSSLSCSARCSQ